MTEVELFQLYWNGGSRVPPVMALRNLPRAQLDNYQIRSSYDPSHIYQTVIMK